MMLQGVIESLRDIGLESKLTQVSRSQTHCTPPNAGKYSLPYDQLSS